MNDENIREPKVENIREYLILFIIIGAPSVAGKAPCFLGVALDLRNNELNLHIQTESPYIHQFDDHRINLSLLFSDGGVKKMKPIETEGNQGCPRKNGQLSNLKIKDVLQAKTPPINKEKSCGSTKS